jgi:2-keto-4-pentenoate hydratase/2-oxohepta-3-ene-1,7-dioic acid hydratase in catechol pathway
MGDLKLKLARFGECRREKPGILTDNGERLDLSAYFADWDGAFLSGNGLARLHEILRDQQSFLPRFPENIRIGSPIARPGKIICVGLNYSDHAAESGMPIPIEPIIFMKASNTVIGPYDEIQIPRGSEKTDWEVELGVVIGHEARYLNHPDEAAVHIAGYVLSHDVSERAFQLERGGQWTKGKSCDTFNPLGPFLLTSDALPDPHHLSMSLKVNGIQRQTGDTATMIFDVFTLVHYLSQFMTLEPGDLISTGTPPGVGLGMTPPQYLKMGDVVELEIELLGTQRQSCVAAG